MKKITSLFIVIILIIFNLENASAYEREIKNLTSAVTSKISQAGKRNIAVVDFTDLQGNVTELGRFISEEFSVTLADTNRGFQVVDRTHLKSILREHNLSTTGIIDITTAKKLGKIVGLDALITGTITPFGDSVRLSVKVLDTATARVIASSSADIAKTKAIEELLSRGIESGQSGGSPSMASATTSSIRMPNAKKVGNFMISVKKIALSSDGHANIVLDFLNQSEKECVLACAARPTLVDDKGNNFSFDGGLQAGWVYGKWLTLYPKSNNDVLLTFQIEDRNIKMIDVGSKFELSLIYLISDDNEKTSKKAQVSFQNINAQKPR